LVVGTKLGTVIWPAHGAKAAGCECLSQATPQELSGLASPEGMGTHTRRNLTVKFLLPMVQFHHLQLAVGTKKSIQKRSMRV